MSLSLCKIGQTFWKRNEFLKQELNHGTKLQNTCLSVCENLEPCLRMDKSSLAFADARYTQNIKEQIGIGIKDSCLLFSTLFIRELF